MRILVDRKRRVLAAVLVALALIGGVWALVLANNIALDTTVFATDYVAAGVGGMRGIGTGSIVVSGVSGTVTKALLYWHGPTNSTSSTDNASVTFDGNAITGTFIGASDDNCWGYTESHAFRADVTAYVPGDGTYSLSGFLKVGPPLIDINGVSLLVFFNDGNAANNRDIVIFHGNDSNISNSYDADGWNVTLSGITYTAGTAGMQLHVGDGQPWDDDAIILNSLTLVSGGAGSGTDGVVDGTTAQNPNAAGAYLRLWDINSFDVTSFLSPGPNTLTMTTGVYSDCLSLVVAVIDLPAGAAPEQPTPTPTLAPEPTPTPTPEPGQLGRMTGGGTVGTSDVRHGFELYCDLSLPNNLEVNWGKNNKFHLESLTSASCSDDPGISEGQPVAGFDTYVGSGTGRYNGVSGHTIDFVFTDAGEPGKGADLAKIAIDGGATLAVSGTLNSGNQQAHPD